MLFFIKIKIIHLDNSKIKVLNPLTTMPHLTFLSKVNPSARRHADQNRLPAFNTQHTICHRKRVKITKYIFDLRPPFYLLCPRQGLNSMLLDKIYKRLYTARAYRIIPLRYWGTLGLSPLEHCSNMH